MARRLNITVLVDTAAIPADDPDFEGTAEVQTTEYHVINTLRELRHRVSVLGVEEDIGKIVDTLTEKKPDIVFNLTEEFNGDRRLDKNIVALLEMLGIPFTGSDVTGLMLSRDKRLCKELLSLHKIRVPGFISLPRGRSVHVPSTLRYPLVVKPAFEDSSEGISYASLVADKAALKERVKFVHERWEQAAIAEEYVAGRELYVCILGNKRLTVFPVRECFFDTSGGDRPHLATYHVKWSEEYRRKWNIKFGFAELDEAVLKNVKHVCKRAYRILKIQDYGRVDVRLTPDNKVVVLEANPNPDIAYGEEMAESVEKGGISYEKFIDRILKSALQRYR